jgi:hypothetical protein
MQFSEFAPDFFQPILSAMNYSSLLAPRALGSWVIGTDMGGKLFVAL